MDTGPISYMEVTWQKQGKSEGFDSCDRPSNPTQIRSKSSIFSATWPWNLVDGLENNRESLPCPWKLCVSYHSHQWIQIKVTIRKHSNRSQIVSFFTQCDLEIVRMTFKNIRASLSCYFVHHFKAIAEFKLGVTSVTLKPLNLGQNRRFLSRVTLEFDRWLWKTIGHISYTTSRFVHHFNTMCEFKLELRSGNGWVGVWPLWHWQLTTDLDLLHGYHFRHW